MRVWAPTFPLEIQLEANVLRPLGLGEFDDDFSFGTSSCPKFSSSRVRVYATFSAGNTKRDVKRVDVTSLVSGAIKATSSFANVSAQNGAVYAAGNMPGKQGLRMKEPSTYCLATVARQQPNAAQPIACAHAPTRSTDPTTRWTGQSNTHKPAGVPPPHPPSCSHCVCDDPSTCRFSTPRAWLLQAKPKLSWKPQAANWAVSHSKSQMTDARTLPA